MVRETSAMIRCRTAPSSLSDVTAANTRASIQSGKLLLPMKVTTSASIEQLVFLLQFGETVTITLQQ
jgi:hypothetical protein